MEISLINMFVFVTTGPLVINAFGNKTSPQYTEFKF